MPAYSGWMPSFLKSSVYCSVCLRISESNCSRRVHVNNRARLFDQVLGLLRVDDLGHGRAELVEDRLRRAGRGPDAGQRIVA